ncbi:MAG: flagellar hook-associated protein FlgK [Verrucomicrobiota bacterium]|jgi:flagellar hook-associated protein 1 FlgK
MPGLFGNLTLAAKALQAQQAAIGVTGRNISNVNNPDYARQRVILGERYHVDTAVGPEGTGVEVISVDQMRDALLDRQVVRQASDAASYAAQQDALSTAELALGDKIDTASNPTALTDANSSTSGISGALDDFFNRMGSLTASPADTPTRQAAIDSANILADRINNANDRLVALQGDLELQLKADMDKANALLAHIAELNAEIRNSAAINNGSAPDLIDKRQKALEDLAGLVKFDMTIPVDSPSQVDISIGGQLLVTYGLLPKGTNPLSYTTASPQANGAYPLTSAPGYTAGKFMVGSLDVTTSLTGGAAYGRYAALTGAVSTIRSNIEKISKQISTSVNAVYQPALVGTAKEFFASTPSSGLLQVNTALTAANLATGSTSDPNVGSAGADPLSANTNTNAGDNGFIKSIFALRNRLYAIGSGDQFSGKMGDYLRTSVASLAQSLQTVAGRASESKVVDSALRAQRDSVSGVSLDEETTNLMQYQRAYQANARVISVIDAMLESVINSMVR